MVEFLFHLLFPRRTVLFDSPANVDGYSNFADVLNEVRDVYVDDLVRYTSRLSPEYSERLKPFPRGVYVRGMLEPVINFEHPSKRYYTESQFRTNRAFPNVSSFPDFISSREAIVDERGVVVCTIPALIPGFFSEVCDYNYSAIHLAVATVWELLEGLNPNTHVCTSIPRQHLDYRFWFKEAPETLTHGNFDIGALTDNVYTFAKRDYLHMYTLRLQNTTLYVEKGNDFRVVEYYRSIFEKLESDRFEKLGF